ncbi:hypothetical protein EDB82DRAFT_548480 [Fusarium venenatum]|uniref:uncharacterized protein n=1 Tax=Fusarium venenatum TaxID=56646 RepID=UPI001E016AA4|nr:hypothetical protein EDB82DRAFT_548480 [Fusarium venenatum]
MEEHPDLVVSVDLGTTFTGVAWMRHGIPIQIVNDWPGSDDRGDRKVPTATVYNADGSISSWGFMCADDDHDSSKTRREFFKIFLDPDTLEAAQQQGLTNVPRSTGEARQFVTDYLKLVYAHVKDSIEIRMGIKHVGGWGILSVLFLFSAPTTWTSIAVVNAFKGAIHDAGFGTEGSRHSALVDLTESEAAAVATLKTGAVNLQANSIFLTVDAGGGTTDLALMRVESTNFNFPQLSQVTATAHLPGLSRKEWLRIPTSDCLPILQREWPGVLDSRVSNTSLEKRCICSPCTRLRDIQALFDVHIEAIMERIKQRLHWLKDQGHCEQVGYVILSGGLGSSAYVREALQEHLTKLQHSNARNIIVIPSQDPQLVVARGVLENKRQRMESGNKSVLSSWIARASYGVIVQEVYMPAQHFDEDIRQDPWNPDVKWATNQIQWLIKKGDTVNPDTPINKLFEIRLKDGDTTRAWDAEIVVSNNEPQWLPRSLKQAGAMKLCSVRSNLAGIEQHQLVLKEKRGTCFRRGHKFYICRFDVRVIVAPVDLRFELWFNKTKFSGNHQPVSVQWDAAEK